MCAILLIYWPATSCILSPYVTQIVELDLSAVVPCCSGPKRPHDRVAVSEMKQDFQTCLRNKVGFKVEGEQNLKKTKKKQLPVLSDWCMHFRFTI